MPHASRRRIGNAGGRELLDDLRVDRMPAFARGSTRTRTGTPACARRMSSAE